ncbi:hypothetical protein HY988_05400 [Candidatus Micrarchaeota archaeon]|nr:hypothetical protein [Candidatus Micrarchaeota archaeon]
MTRLKVVSREKYVIFKEKAEAFYDAMLSEFNFAAQNPGRYTTCVSSAVHCAISWVDALTVYKSGKKSSDSNHASAIILLKGIPTSNDQERARICQHLLTLIELKNPSEYEDRRISKAEAEKAVQLCKKIDRFIRDELQRAEVFS